MIASAEWQGDLRFKGRSESGHTQLLDASAAHEAGPSPMEAVLTALCACTSVDVVGILHKKRQNLRGLCVEAAAERQDNPPRVFTRIHLTYKASGAGLDRAAVERAVELSKEKYCSVSRMLAGTVEMTHTVELEDTP